MLALIKLQMVLADAEIAHALVELVASIGSGHEIAALVRTGLTLMMALD